MKKKVKELKIREIVFHFFGGCFLYEMGFRVGHRTVDKIIGDCLKEVEAHSLWIEKHSLRRTFTLRMLQVGSDLYLWRCRIPGEFRSIFILLLVPGSEMSIFVYLKTYPKQSNE